MKTTEIENRIDNLPVEKILTVTTTLKDFSIITYTVDIEKLRRVIPERFDIYTIILHGKKFGLVSAVTFIDKDFCFKRLLPFVKFNFPQTNYRAYIVDRVSGEKCVWFFGTGLGSQFVQVPKIFWKMPWFYSHYTMNFEMKGTKYSSYKVDIQAEKGNANIDIAENETIDFISDGFSGKEEAELILTHPITGYFLRTDNQIGRYQIWHPKMEYRTAQCNNAYFQKYETLGLLNKEEMKRPYSILITNEIYFIIDLPPHKIG